jgi:hypothetical protein
MDIATAVITSRDKIDFPSITAPFCLVLIPVLKIRAANRPALHEGGNYDRPLHTFTTIMPLENREVIVVNILIVFDVNEKQEQGLKVSRHSQPSYLT